MREHNTEKEYFFDKPGNMKICMWVFFAALVVVAVAGFFISRHPYFPWEHYPLFYGVCGLAGCTVLIVGAKYILRSIVKREETYYD